MLNINFIVSNTNIVLLQGDFNRSVEVIQNLVEKAIKYSDNKEISIDDELEDSYLLIHIKNTGVSINPLCSK